jgi:RHS repeat-associated protein
VTVNYYSYSQAGGPTNTGWAWLNNAGNPGWTVVGAADMNQDGVPDLIWINKSDSQHAIGAVTANYYGGAGGATYEGWAWLNQAGISGWSVGAVADMNSSGEPDLIWQNASSPNTVTAYYYSLAGVCDYTYDDLARLSAANCGSVWAQTFSYDAFGNIGKSGSQSFMPIYSAVTNQMTSIGSFTPSYEYDSNGNLRGDGPYNTYSWDGEGNLATLNGNAETYDALDRRVEQYNGSAYTEIVYGPAGNKLALMNGQTATKVFAPLSGGATAVYNSSGLQYYRHPDWLGSSRIASTPGRTVYYDGAYAPYGENYAETGTTDRNFTGQNQDLTPGSSGILYDFLYREQHSTEGRWISPDPAGIRAVDPTSPQSWNRYAYVLGNPLANTDPLGLCSASDNPPCYSTTGTAYSLNFSSCAQFVMFFNLTNFPGGGNPCVALGGASPASFVNQQSTGGHASPTPNNGFGKTPVHGLWTYGKWCGAGGSGTPINSTDSACMAHDLCYDKAGFSPGSNFQGSNAQLQACNQQLCNAVKARQNSLTQSLGKSWLPAVPPENVSNELTADADINFYFTWVVAPGGNACH